MRTQKNIKEIRNKLKMTQLKFSIALGITPSTVANWENGKRQPSIKASYKLIKLAKKNGLEIGIEDIYSE